MNPQRGKKTSTAQISCPNRETQKLLRELIRQGFNVERRGSGHYMITRNGSIESLCISGTDVSNGVRRSWEIHLGKMGYRS